MISSRGANALLSVVHHDAVCVFNIYPSVSHLISISIFLSRDIYSLLYSFYSPKLDARRRPIKCKCHSALYILCPTHTHAALHREIDPCIEMFSNNIQTRQQIVSIGFHKFDIECFFLFVFQKRIKIT